MKIKNRITLLSSPEIDELHNLTTGFLKEILKFLRNAFGKIIEIPILVIQYF